MKRSLIIGLLLLAGSWAHASVIYSQTFSGGTVTGGNPVGTVFTGNFTADPNSDQVLAISVSLNVSGGYSGGFYFSLVGPDGVTTVILLDQPGTVTDGLNITLANGGSAINSGSDLSSGTYSAYGALSGLNGQSADGTWTLYFSDTTSGESPTLGPWTLDITVVPEPVEVALGVFGVLFAAIVVVRRRTGKLAGNHAL